MIELFIAKKYSRAKHKLSFIGILSVISTLGITIGVAALVIVLSVFNGFGSIVTNILVSFDPHVKIFLRENISENHLNDLQSKLKSFNEIESIYSTLEGKTLFINNKTYDVVNFKGVAISSFDNWSVKKKIISGENDLSENKIIIGLSLALKFGVRVGDTITVTSANDIEKTIISLTLPQTRKFVISALFESNNKDYDAAYAFSSLESAKKLFGPNKAFTGIEIRLHNFDEAVSFKDKIQKKIDFNNAEIMTWYDFHKQLYNVMLIERWAAYIILCLIIAVASFNIFASLTMTVIEKKRDIGILRSLGVAKNSIKNIFMLSGLMIGAAGTLTGLIIGLLVCFLQINYKFYSLDPMKYIIDALPIQVKFFDILVISLMALFLSYLAAFFPAKQAAKSVIIDTIKYE